MEEALSHSRRVATSGEEMTRDRVQEALGVMPETLLPGKVARLDALLEKSDAQRTQVMLAKTDLPKDWQPRVKPWVAIALMPSSDCEQQRQRQGKLTLEAEIGRQAENRGVGSFGLETAEMELSVLAALPDDEQVSLLKARLASRDQQDDLTETLVQLYLAHDIGALWPIQAAFAKARGADAKSIAAYHQGMFVDRNARMRDRALMHLSTGGVFIAVGAEHLPGDQGMVEMLREAGYKLTALE